MKGRDWIGKRVRFAPNPRLPEMKIEAEVRKWRTGPRFGGMHAIDHRYKPQGWLDTVDDEGFERSVRPSRCEIVD